MILGTRKTDPGCLNQGNFAKTDQDWPQIMRVNPIIDWDYASIWTFIRGLSVPYPVLYDRGFTSLGKKSQTLPNPHLSYKTGDGRVLFKPAYELENEAHERAGRNTSKV